MKLYPSLNTAIFNKTYGGFSNQPDGRLAGHQLTINNVRRDGKYFVTHAFGSGKRINKIYSAEQLVAEIQKMESLATS